MASLIGQGGQVLTPDQVEVRRRLAQQMYDGQTGGGAPNYARPGGTWSGINDAVNKVGGAINEKYLEGQQNQGRQSATDAAMGGFDALTGGMGQSGQPTGLAQQPPPGFMPNMMPMPGGPPPNAPNFTGGTGALPNARPSPYPTTQPAGGTQPMPPFGGAPSNGGGMDRWKAAISNNESGGRYDLLGPIQHTGDYAVGKYQVMASNVPSWTRAALGVSMTPEQFRASPEAQEHVFEHQFGGYVAKYGNPEDAASAWFTGGPRTAKSMASHDSLGTSGAGYVNKFDRFLGQNPQAAAQPQGPPGMMAAAASPTGAVSTNGPPQNAQPQPQFGERGRATAAMDGTDTTGAQPFGPPGQPLPPQPQAPPQQPAQQPQGGQMGGYDPRQAAQVLRPLMAAISNPWIQPAQAQMLSSVAQPYLSQLGPVNYQTTTQPDGSVWAFNPRNPSDARQIAPATHHYMSMDQGYGRKGVIDEFSGLPPPGQPQSGGQPMGGQPQGGAQPQMAGAPQDQGGGDLVQGVDIIPGPGGVPMLSPSGLKKIGQEGDTVPWFQDPANGFWKRSDGTGILSPVALQQKIQATAAERRSQPVTTKAGATTSGTIEDAIGNMNAPGYKAPSFTEPGKTGNRVEDALDYYGQRDTFAQSNAIPGMAGGKVVAVDFPNEATEARKSAQDVAKSAGDVASLQAEQSILRRNLDVLNNQGGSYLNTGTGGRERLNVARAFNTIGTMFGLKDEELPFDPKQLAAGADLSKIATLQGLQNSRIAGAREAQAIVQQSINATANMENSPSENNLVLADMMQIAQQKMDYAKFASKYLSKYPKSDGISLSEAFVEAFPPEEYAAGAIKQAADWDAARAKSGAPPQQTTQAAPVAGDGAAQAAPAPAADRSVVINQFAQLKQGGAPADAQIQFLKANNVPPEVAFAMMGGQPPQAGPPPAPQAQPQAAHAAPPQGQPPATSPGPYGAPIGDRMGLPGVLQRGMSIVNGPPPAAQMAPAAPPAQAAPAAPVAAPAPPPVPFDPIKLRSAAQQFLGPHEPQYQFNQGAGNPVQGMNAPQAQPPLPQSHPSSMFGPPIQPLFGSRQAPPSAPAPQPVPQTGPEQATSVSPEAGQNAKVTGPSDTGIQPLRTTTQGRDAILAGQNPAAVAKGLIMGGIDPGRAAQALILAGIPPDKAKALVAAAQRTLR